jgi:DNA-binding GntR family transcriptional regulator
LTAFLLNRETKTISVQTAPQAAAQTLREAILSGELKGGGDRILEQHWSNRLAIGQPTLREAIRELEHQGLVRKTQQRGTYVTKLGPEDYQRILEVRLPLESLAVSAAATRLNDESEKELVKLIRQMAGHEKNGSVGVFHDCDVLFHRTIWDLAGNEYLSEILETITFRLFVFSVVGRWPNTPNAAKERLAAIHQHKSILEGIRTRDAKKARVAFVRSTVNYWNQQYGLSLNESAFLGMQ